MFVLNFHIPLERQVSGVSPPLLAGASVETTKAGVLVMVFCFLGTENYVCYSIVLISKINLPLLLLGVFSKE